MAKLDNCRFNPTLGGTTDWTYSSAVAGYQSPTLAGVVTATPYECFAIDASNNWEISTGNCTITGGVPTFARTTVLYNSLGTGTATGQSGAGTKITFAAAPTVAIVEIKERIIAIDEANGFTTAQQATILKNAGAAQFSLINGKIVESHASNAATFAIKTFAGADPSAIDPVSAIMADGTVVSLTAALSVTIPSTGTLGTTSGVAFRLWFALINDAGTLRLGVRNCTGATGTVGFPGDGILSSTIITTPNSSGVTYTGTAVAAKQFVIAGFADYESGLTTAGTWAVSPTRIQLFGPHIKKPGDTLQELYFANSGNTVTTSSTLQSTGLTGSITPGSICNPVTVDVRGAVYTSNAASSGVTARITRGGTAMGTAMQGGGATSGAQNSPSVTSILFDRPASNTSVTYLVKVQNGDNATSVEWNHNFSETDMVLYELMG